MHSLRETSIVIKRDRERDRHREIRIILWKKIHGLIETFWEIYTEKEIEADTERMHSLRETLRELKRDRDREIILAEKMHGLRRDKFRKCLKNQRKTATKESKLTFFYNCKNHRCVEKNH